VSGGYGARPEQTSGECRRCGKRFTKGGMARHVRSCQAKMPGGAGTGGLLVALGDAAVSSYWLIVRLAAEATWYDLDDFLRAIWVECCGHMSCFLVGGRTFTAHPEQADWADDPASMDEMIADTVGVDSRFRYEYDFGTTTELEGRVLATAAGAVPGPVEVLARNDPPQWRCADCGSPATEVCGMCYLRLDAPCWYCETCRSRHHCDAGGDFFLPVVNSPRVGLCGYTGPDRD